MIRILLVVAFSALLFLQYKLWLGDGTIPAVLALRDQVLSQEIKLKILEQQNAKLLAEVEDLKKGTEAIEERARKELGMIKEDETFFQYIEPEKS